MKRPMVRRGLGLVLAAVVAKGVLARREGAQHRARSRSDSWPPVPVAPPVTADTPPAPAPSAPAPAPWVPPQSQTCPTSHPVKAKLSSKIFHLPGMVAYQRTIPDRCYLDGSAAEADGLRRAKR